MLEMLSSTPRGDGVLLPTTPTTPTPAAAS